MIFRWSGAVATAAASSSILLQLAVIGSIISMVSSQREIIGVASPGNYIHSETNVDLPASLLAAGQATITIDSPVPVTIQRFSDNSSVEGQQPVTSDMAKVLVTSNCDTSETTVVPNVSVSPDGRTISVDLDGASSGGGGILGFFNVMPFLEPSSYSAAWRTVNDLCGGLFPGGPDLIPTPPVVATVVPTIGDTPALCQTGPAANDADDCQTDGEFCKLDMGACNDKAGIHFGTCYAKADSEICLGVYMPVCGCDGTTYSNDCVAFGAGTSVSRMGKCEDPPVRACQNKDGTNFGDEGSCQSDEFCKLEVGICSDTGSAPLNGFCAAIADLEACISNGPVCGCNGLTYSNECEAYGDGVSVFSERACIGTSTTVVPMEITGSGSSTASCQTSTGALDDGDDGPCDDGEFCQIEAGVCGNDGSDPWDGTCVPTSNFEACIALYDPVCGCDGITYSNECVAYGKGVSISSNGECDKLPVATAVPPSSLLASCTTKSGSFAADHDGSCQLGEFCQLSFEICSTEGYPYSGVCASLTEFEACIDLYAPVCGCDGKTYSNECNAYQAGVSVSSQGECLPTGLPSDGSVQSCQTINGTLAGDDGTCPGGQLCHLEPGVCGSGNLPYFGECAQMPQACPENYSPVCGCDGKNYDNDCFANGAGVSVSYDGLCTNDSQLVACETGQCLDPVGVCGPQTNCFVDPCEFEKGCEDDEVCVSNYCGGCHAVCTPREQADQKPTVINPIIDKPVTIGGEAVCGVNNICFESGTTCSKGTETCCGQTYDSIQCECGPGMNGQLQYNCYNTDACMMPSCCMPGPPTGKPPPADNYSCNVGELCDTGVPDDYCCFDWQGGTGRTYCTVSGGKASEPASPTNAPTTSQTASPTKNPSMSPSKSPTEQVTSTTATTVGTTAATTEETTMESSAATQATSTVPSTVAVTPAASTLAASTVASTMAASTGETTTGASLDGSSAATTVTSTSTGATTDSTTATAATTFAAIDPDFPTESPIMKDPTSSPTTWWQKGSDLPEGTNSAFFRPHSITTCLATAFMAIALLSVIIPGYGAHSNLGFGKFVVAAMAASTVYKSSPGTIRKRTQGPKQALSQNNERALQTCSYNVEVLLDGCAYSAEINAPAGRIVDVSIDNKTSQQDPEDECVTDYRAELNFPVTDDNPTTVLNLQDNTTAPGFGGFDFRCLRPVIGRPFVDATGGTLQAMPMIHNTGEAESCISSLSWTDSATEQDVQSFTGNSTTHSHLMMGEDWTQRALGEHSSVASFSAFSIALMTNQAPSDLVHAALMAGLDEVRHAKVSFDIASKLTGKKVGPGPLPPSSHEFGQDLTALALAVAREGCVDETLSAFSAALEVEHINAVLNEGLEDTFYSDVEPGTLAFIRDALVTIAIDESNHSALAWRTLNWVCGVDTSACDAVQRDVFDDETLQLRFDQRADSPFGEKERLLQRMRDEWKKVFNANMLSQSSNEGEPVNESTCEKDTVEADEAGTLSHVSESIIRQAVCS